MGKRYLEPRYRMAFGEPNSYYYYMLAGCEENFEDSSMFSSHDKLFY